MRFSLTKQKVLSFFVMGAFFVVVLILTRQVPLKGLSFLMNLALLAFFGMQIINIIQINDRSRLVFLILFVGWCCLLFAYSAIVIVIAGIVAINFLTKIAETNKQ